MPFYDGLVEFAVFSPVAVDCKNRASGSNIEGKYLFFNWELVCKIKCSFKFKIEFVFKCGISH